jgi:hypothetical protein
MDQDNGTAKVELTEDEMHKVAGGLHFHITTETSALGPSSQTSAAPSSTAPLSCTRVL